MEGKGIYFHLIYPHVLTPQPPLFFAPHSP